MVNRKKDKIIKNFSSNLKITVDHEPLKLSQQVLRIRAMEMAKKLSVEELDNETRQFLQQCYAPAFRRSYLKFEGFVLAEHFKDFAERIKNMEIRDDDIWVCTFPKSGTTWIQEMVWLLMNNMDFEAAKVKLSERFPALEFSATFHYEKIKTENKEFADVFCAYDSVEKVINLKSPRFIKSHLPFPLLPEQLRNFSTNAKIIYVYRNPRDNFISRYHYSKLMQGYEGTFQQLAELYLAGNVPYGPVPDHIKGFLAHSNNPNVLMLRFEDMKKDLKSVIEKTAAFIGANISEENMHKLLDHLSFSNMKNNPALNHQSSLDIRRKYNVTKSEGQFFRSGAAGSWKQEMDPELCERFEKWEEENFQGIDLIHSL